MVGPIFMHETELSLRKKSMQFRCMLLTEKRQLLQLSRDGRRLREGSAPRGLDDGIRPVYEHTVAGDVHPDPGPHRHDDEQARTCNCSIVVCRLSTERSTKVGRRVKEMKARGRRKRRRPKRRWLDKVEDDIKENGLPGVEIVRP